MSPDGRHLYAARDPWAAASCGLRFGPTARSGTRRRSDPKASAAGAFPDGFAFDPFGNVWVTIISRNGPLREFDRHGDLHVVYHDANEAAVEAMTVGVERRNGTVEHLVACASARGPLRLPTSLAFGGAGRADGLCRIAAGGAPADVPPAGRFRLERLVMARLMFSPDT